MTDDAEVKLTGEETSLAVVEPRSMSKRIEAGEPVALGYSRSENYTHVYQDMSPQQSATLIEVAKQTYAVPAQEETKRSAHVTTRITVTGGVVVLGMGAMLLNPAVAPYIGGLILVLAAFGVVTGLIKKPPTP